MLDLLPIRSKDNSSSLVLNSVIFTKHFFPELTYVKVKEVSSGRHYILMEARLGSVFKQESDYEVLDKFPGAKLKGKSYKPLFDYFAHMKEQGAFKVLTDGYVTEDSGTGVVHQAPFFGEDDNRVCKAHGVITPGMVTTSILFC